MIIDKQTGLLIMGRLEDCFQRRESGLATSGIRGITSEHCSHTNKLCASYGATRFHV